MSDDTRERGTVNTGFPKPSTEDRRRMALTSARSPVCAVRIHRPGHAPFVLPLDGARPTLLVGRGEQADVRLLGDDRVSRVHGMLRKEDDEWFFVDLGSANGSFSGSKEDAVDETVRWCLEHRDHLAAPG